MKKSLTLGLAVVLATVLFAGCTKKESTTTETTTETSTEAPAVVEETGTMTETMGTETMTTETTTTTTTETMTTETMAPTPAP